MRLVRHLSLQELKRVGRALLLRCWHRMCNQRLEGSLWHLSHAHLWLRTVILELHHLSDRWFEAWLKDSNDKRRTKEGGITGKCLNELKLESRVPKLVAWLLTARVKVPGRLLETAFRWYHQTWCSFKGDHRSSSQLNADLKRILKLAFSKMLLLYRKVKIRQRYSVKRIKSSWSKTLARTSRVKMQLVS